jgi:hypothetical protein
MYKETEPYMPIEGKQDRHLPAIDKLDYNNYIVSLLEYQKDAEWQFILRDGASCGILVSRDNCTRIEVN